MSRMTALLLTALLSPAVVAADDAEVVKLADEAVIIIARTMVCGDELQEAQPLFDDKMSEIEMAGVSTDDAKALVRERGKHISELSSQGFDVCEQ